MPRYPSRNENGFTLIEVIVSLVLIGVMAAVAGMGLVAITQSYVFSQQNNKTSLKAQVALAKMVKEISSLGIEPCTTLTAAAITTAQTKSISYTYTCNGTITNHTIAQSGTRIQLTASHWSILLTLLISPTSTTREIQLPHWQIFAGWT